MLRRKKYFKLSANKLLLTRVRKTSPFPPSGSGWVATPLFTTLITNSFINKKASLMQVGAFL